MTRQELADRLGWAKNTVAARLQEVEETSWVRSVPRMPTHRGRPSAAHSLDPHAGTVLIASASQHRPTFALAHLDGTVLGARTRPFPDDIPLTTILASGAEARDELLRDQGLDRDSLLHAVVGVPGAVDRRGNIALFRLATNDHEEDVLTLATEMLGVPTAVENDANLMALGEHHLHHPSVSEFAYVTVGAGIGAGTLADGRLVRGARGMAGELGHVPIQRGITDPCFCGNAGCVAQFASLPATTQRAGSATSTREALERVHAGDAVATEAVRQAGRDLGEALVGPSRRSGQR